MKIIHLSDTHLGYSAYAKVTPSGINQREQDIYDSFTQVIDRILEMHPDMVVHAGDVFHTPRPSNRAITQALIGFQRLSSHGIPTVVIGGNHSMPRIRSSSCILESIALFPKIHVAFKGEYEQFRINKALVHCVPHCGTEEEMIQAFDAVRPSGQGEMNILVTHAGLTADVDYVMGEFNELKVPAKIVIDYPDMDYIALGHYHRSIKVSQRAYYSGSTERFGFSDAGHPCGFLEVDLPAGVVTYHEIEIRAKVERKPQYRRDLMDLEKRLEVVRGSMDKNSREREALGFDEGKHRAVKEGLEEMREARDRLIEDRSRIRERRAKTRAEIEGKRREIAHERGLRERVELLQELVQYLDVLVEIFVSFRMDLMGRIRPLLESRTSQLLSLVTDGRYSVVELDEDYNIFIYDGNEKFRIQRFSGGEQDVFNLCLRIAISQIVADRGGGEINFIALDEIFGSQDVERRENILKIFNGLSSQFRQIFLITHIEEVKDMMPVVWSVEEVSDGLSTVIT